MACQHLFLFFRVVALHLLILLLRHKNTPAISQPVTCMGISSPLLTHRYSASNRIPVFSFPSFKKPSFLLIVQQSQLHIWQSGKPLSLSARMLTFWWRVSIWCRLRKNMSFSCPLASWCFSCSCCFSISHTAASRAACAQKWQVSPQRLIKLKPFSFQSLLQIPVICSFHVMAVWLKMVLLRNFDQLLLFYKHDRQLSILDKRLINIKIAGMQQTI